MTKDFLPCGFQQLDGSNWNTWWTLMQDVLQGKWLWLTVTCAELCPSLTDVMYDLGDLDDGFWAYTMVGSPAFQTWKTKSVSASVNDNIFHKKLTDWQQDDMQACVLICMGCVQAICKAMQLFNTAIELWNGLCNLYGKESALTIIVRMNCYYIHSF
jgi:hypothetical protein